MLGRRIIRQRAGTCCPLKFAYLLQSNMHKLDIAICIVVLHLIFVGASANKHYATANLTSDNVKIEYSPPLYNVQASKLNSEPIPKTTTINTAWLYSNYPSQLRAEHFQSFTIEQQKLLIAISIAETRFMQDSEPSRFKNPFNYFCVRNNKQGRADCGFTSEMSLEYTTTRLGELIVRDYISKLNGVSRAELERVFIGSYCVSGCEHFIDNVLASYNSL